MVLVLKIIEQIEAYRERKGQNKREFYGGLPGISETYIYKLIDDSRQPGRQFLAAVAATYPELKPLIIEAMLNIAADD